MLHTAGSFSRDASATAVARDLRRASDEMLEAWSRLDGDAWLRRGHVISGERTIREMLWARVREVEVHHVDLAVGYEPIDWPVGFVNGALDEIFTSFARREQTCARWWMVYSSCCRRITSARGESGCTVPV